MASLQGRVICSAVREKQTRVHYGRIGSSLLKFEYIRTGFGGLSSVRINAGCSRGLSKCRIITCTFSCSSSDGNGNMAGNSNENDADYVNSSVIEAVGVKSGPDCFIIKMRDGTYMRCVHNNPQLGRLPDSSSHPAIVLKMEDGTGFLLPIIVPEMSSLLLMAAIRNVQIARPTMYQVGKDMIERMGYIVKHVRVTKRVHDTYFADIHLTKLNDEAESLSFDLRPSDAINIAVRCKVPIQVNKVLAYSDCMRMVDSSTVLVQNSSSNGFYVTELDRPTEHLCIETMEFNLLRNMLIAAIEERYMDAALWRDKLTQLRSKRNWT